MRAKTKFEKRFLCYQEVVMKEGIVGTTNKIEIGVVIRNVGAKSQEEAIGKFILATSEIEVQKRLEPTCFPLDNLIKID
ncbi:MAG TPA: hypothetical protein VLZ72_05435 [Flavobacterium sp.]|nr:hypothetical protein [Flavobacterium sp.]